MRAERVLAVSIALLALATSLAGEQTKHRRYDLRSFDNSGCMAKGRVQDCPTRVMRQILADGKDAIPILISQVTETAPAKNEIADYWFGTRTGDVAFVVLDDLFSDVNGNFKLPDAIGWEKVRDGCENISQTCWNEYVRKHGRVSVQQAWLRAWNMHKNQIEWDSRESCFRLAKK